MDILAKLLFRTISSIYESTISGSSFYPMLYFSDKNPKTIYYGYRVSNIIPSRIFVRITPEKKWEKIDLLWLVDDSVLTGEGCVTITNKKKEIDIHGKTDDLIKTITEDATIQACYPDLMLDNDLFDIAVLGSNNCFKEIEEELKINTIAIPCKYYAFSSCRINEKQLYNEDYQEIIINCLLSLIDLIHRTLEILTERKKNIEKKEKTGKQMFCIRCGYSIPDPSYYCPYCGSKQ